MRCANEAAYDIEDAAVRAAHIPEQEEQYRSIFNATSDGMVIVDMQGNIVQANPAYCRMHGYVLDELIGLPVAALMHPDDAHLVSRGIETIRSGGTTEERSRGVRKDGSTFYAEARGVTFSYRGQPHVLAVVRDVTERVEAEAAVREERQRLSRELHDSVSQALYSIVLGTKTAQTLLGRNPEEAAEALNFVLTQAETGLAEMRALIFELRPETLEQEGLAGVLERQAQLLRSRAQLVVEMAVCEEPTIPLAAKEALYRIAQEALNNVVKHAQASKVHVSLACERGHTVLAVRDNGKGFETSSSFPGHLGLRSMRERVACLGGAIRVESAPGMGTRLEARIPD